MTLLNQFTKRFVHLIFFSGYIIMQVSHLSEDSMTHSWQSLFFFCWMNKCFWKNQLNKWISVGLGDISHAICMRISSVKPVPWLAVNLHHLFSNRAVFNTQSRSSLKSWLSLSLSQMNQPLDNVTRYCLAFQWTENRPALIQWLTNRRCST